MMISNAFLLRWTSTLLFLMLSVSVTQLHAWPDRTPEPLVIQNDIYPDRLPDPEIPTTVQSDTTRPPPVTKLTYIQGENHIEKRLQGNPGPGWHVEPAFRQPLRRFVGINLWYPIYRIGSIIGSNHGVPSNPILQRIEYMYTRIRNAALTEWAKLPEQSIFRIVYGHLVFIILPPSDRTVPWSAVEEIAHWLLMVLATGAEFVMMGFYPFRVVTAVTWLYVAVVAPGSPPTTVSMSGRNYTIDENGNVWLYN